MIDDKAIGRALRAAREAKGWTQTQLGDALGVTYQQIQKYEGGTNRLALVTFLEACLALGIPAARSVIAWIESAKR